MTRSRKQFHPRMVPEVRNGYYWLAKDATGFGTTSFRVPEGNKHPTFDLVQSTVASQPTVLTENGGVQFRMRKAADANPTKIKSSASMAGWSGATYIGMWARLPVDLTGINNLFVQGAIAGSRIGVLTVNGTPDLLRINIISPAQSFTNSTFATPFADLGWHYVECVYDPRLFLGGNNNTDYAKAFSDLVQISPIAKGSHPGSLADVVAEVRMAQTATDSATDADNYDWCTCYYANGIPSLKNRKRLANYLAPTSVKFTI